MGRVAVEDLLGDGRAVAAGLAEQAGVSDDLGRGRGAAQLRLEHAVQEAGEGVADAVEVLLRAEDAGLDLLVGAAGFQDVAPELQARGIQRAAEQGPVDELQFAAAVLLALEDVGGDGGAVAAGAVEHPAPEGQAGRVDGPVEEALVEDGQVRLAQHHRGHVADFELFEQRPPPGRRRARGGTEPAPQALQAGTQAHLRTLLRRKRVWRRAEGTGKLPGHPPVLRGRSFSCGASSGGGEWAARAVMSPLSRMVLLIAILVPGGLRARARTRAVRYFGGRVACARAGSVRGESPRPGCLALRPVAAARPRLRCTALTVCNGTLTSAFPRVSRKLHGARPAEGLRDTTL